MHDMLIVLKRKICKDVIKEKEKEKRIKML